MSEPTEIGRLVSHAVDAGRWAGMEWLFERPGDPEVCWCLAWRATPEEARHHDDASRKQAVCRCVLAGVPVGPLGYLEGEPVAWCSVAPRSTCRRLIKDDHPDPGIWSILFLCCPAAQGPGHHPPV